MLLIDNYDRDTNKANALLEEHIKKQSLLVSYNENLLLEGEEEILRFYISFYKKTRCTSYFIDNSESKYYHIAGDEADTKECSKDLIKFISYYKSEEDSTMWYCHYPKDRKDTIWISKELLDRADSARKVNRLIEKQKQLEKELEKAKEEEERIKNENLLYDKNSKLRW